MKKLLLIPVLISLSVLVLPTIGLAACVLDNVCDTLAGERPDNCADCTVPVNADPIQTLNKVLNWVFTILLVFAALMIVVAAFYFVTAAGNPETLTKGREFVIYAMVGVLVALLARGFVWIVQKMI